MFFILYLFKFWIKSKSEIFETNFGFKSAIRSIVRALFFNRKTSFYRKKSLSKMRSAFQEKLLGSEKIFASSCPGESREAIHASVIFFLVVDSVLDAILVRVDRRRLFSCFCKGSMSMSWYILWISPTGLMRSAL